MNVVGALRGPSRVLPDRRTLRQKVVRLALLANQVAAGQAADRERAVDVMDRSWDNLLILDACRYDLFEAHHEFRGRLRKVCAPGSHSREFIEHNFVGGEYHDTVYVTSNPHATLIGEDVFHAVVDLFDDAWDAEAMTVRPESVVEAALNAHRQHPAKRLVVHFMQPHYPFLGENGSRIRSGGVTGETVDREAKGAGHQPSVWTRLDLDDGVDHAEAWTAYVENFQLVQRHASRLVAALDGKSVVTSDHGNLFGERLWPLPVRKYGHPPGLRHPELIEVPWMEIPCQSRRAVTSDPPIEREPVAAEVVAQRLSDLGYA